MVARLNSTVTENLGQRLKNTHFLMVKMSIYSALPKSLVCNNEEKMHIQVTGMNLALIPRMRKHKTKYGSDGKESACNARDLGSIFGLGRSL